MTTPSNRQKLPAAVARIEQSVTNAEHKSVHQIGAQKPKCVHTFASQCQQRRRNANIPNHPFQDLASPGWALESVYYLSHQRRQKRFKRPSNWPTDHESHICSSPPLNPSTPIVATKAEFKCRSNRRRDGRVLRPSKPSCVPNPCVAQKSSRSTSRQRCQQAHRSRTNRTNMTVAGVDCFRHVENQTCQEHQRQ